MARQFPTRVPHVAKSSSVAAGNTGAATRALEARTNLLLEALEAIEGGRLLTFVDQPVEAEALVGQPMFWNATTQRFERAFAAVENNTETATLEAAASADCLGLLLDKSAVTTGTIALLGIARFDTLSNAIDGEVTAGRYYLSASEPGKLVKQRPPVTVAVCYVIGPLDECDTNFWVFIDPQMRDFLEDHIHYRFELVPRPAGTHNPPTGDEVHEITDADPTLQGWLPADDPSFNGTAPAGAAFGYNLAAHEALERVWPPIPVGASAVLWDKGEGMVGATEVCSAGAHKLVQIDAHGIWWMSNCQGDVPWPATLVTGSSASATPSSSSSAGIECPRIERMRVILTFARMTYATDKTVVTSLQAFEDHPLEFVNCDGDPALTGDLFAKLLIAAMIDTTDELGSQVLKTINHPSLKFGAGQVTEGLIAGSDAVELTSSVERYLDPDDDTTPVVHQGIVVVDVNLEPIDRELLPQITKLGDALEREYKNVLYLGLPEGRTSGLRMRFNVPPAGLPSNPKMKLRFLMFGRNDGPWSALELGYYIVVRPTTGSPTPITEGDTALTFDVVTPSTGLSTDDAIEVESEAFDVAAGDTVFVEIIRDIAASPSFSGEIGIIRAGGILYSGS